MPLLERTRRRRRRKNSPSALAAPLAVGLVMLLLSGCAGEPEREWRVLVTWPQPRMEPGRYSGRLQVERGEISALEPRLFEQREPDVLDAGAGGWSTVASPRAPDAVSAVVRGGADTRLVLSCGAEKIRLSAEQLDRLALALGTAPVPEPLVAGPCRIESLAPVAATVVGPSIVRAGVPATATVLLSAATRGADPAESGPVDLALDSDGACEHPATLRVEGPKASFEFSCRAPGLARLSLGRLPVAADTAPALTELRALPLRVLAADERRPALYWGDLQAHTSFSSDAAGDPEAAYDWARDVARLDFLAITDHHWSHARNGTWPAARELANRRNEPGRFVSFVAVEWGAGIDEPGARLLNHHRHVIFPGDDGELFIEQTRRPEFWEALRRRRPGAIAVPHHTGYEVEHLGSDWEISDGVVEPLAELVSGHGSSESPDSPYPLSRPGTKGWVSDALLGGHRLGLLGGSDNHLGRPGSDVARIHRYALAGLTAVRAEALDRASLLAALRARRCYAVMGARRILLEFEVNDEPMGSQLSAAAAREPRRIAIDAAGTGELTRVELLRDERVVQTWEPRDWKLEAEWSDAESLDPSSPHLYRVRVFQRDGTSAYGTPVFIGR